ncbi:D-3-phosphoglycerate dehydrogenase [Talaromyces proteolyticus]|uniref:D-3-phosphoglycerate dehydrogenase n=1 Tax=Talaromyces proteolyticus TaxID=1131652 RepID=A0AAD4KR53_9EURO|nr:D-3-phosphoglycerate dehydrogenase [Talaromyces proteolyticus]KAH8698600.1 D-3-phosphoglycerate dehydrogenase [Talaromyces proteolyticus]
MASGGAADSSSGGQVLLFLTPYSPPLQYIASLERVSPGIRVISRQIPMYATEVPSDISPETWKSVTALLTWKALPKKEQVPNLRYVQLISAGCNHLSELPVFKETDIAYCTANGVHPPQITEWVFSTFLLFQHHIPEHLENQKLGKWIDPPSDEGVEDAVGLRVGILGYGCIGRQCARVAKAFGMDVYAYTLHERATPESRKDESFTEPGLGDPEGIFPSRWFFGDKQLNDFLGSGLDLLIITLPGTTKTKGLITKTQFEILSKKKAFVSNVGRGTIINTDDLVSALENGKIRGASLDVTDPEPLPADHKLWKTPNAIITPHTSGISDHYSERVMKILAYNLSRLHEGKDLINQVDKSLGY